MKKKKIKREDGLHKRTIEIWKMPFPGFEGDEAQCESEVRFPRPWRDHVYAEMDSMKSTLLAEAEKNPGDSYWQNELGTYSCIEGSYLEQDLSALKDLITSFKRYILKPGKEQTVFEIGVHFAEMRARLEAYPVQKYRKSVRSGRENSAAGVAESVQRRRDKADLAHDAIYIYFKSIKAPSDSQRIDKLIEKHGECLKREYPGCGISKSNIYKIIRARK